MKTNPYLETAEAAARAVAPEVLRSFREGTAVHRKSPHELMSDADIESERGIVEAIRATFPDHEFLGEESHRGPIDAEHLWVIDPIDGTNNFVHGIPHFGISIAYLHRGVPTAGVVFDPCLVEMFAAVKGGGAFRNGERIAVSSAQTMGEAIGVTGFPYERGAPTRATLDATGAFFERGAQGMRRFGAASLDLCYVAAGRMEFYFEYDLKPWDFAAGALLVEEAGGRISTTGGEPLPLARSGLLASNGTLHAECLEVVSRHQPPSSA